MAEPFVLDGGTWRTLVDRARRDWPYEVCGLLGIEEDGTTRHFPIDNDKRSMTTYVMNPGQLLQSMREIEDEDLGLAIYHSHTHTSAYPSATDIRLAAYPRATYLIVTLQDRDHPEVRAFRIVDDTVTERPVDVRGPVPAGG